MLITTGQKKVTLILSAFFCVAMLMINLQVAASLILIASFMIWVIVRFDHDPFLAKMLMIAVIMRAVLTIFNEFFPIFPVQSDSFLYNLHAMQIIDNTVRNLPPFYDSPHSMSIKSYSFFLSLFYRVLGEMPLFISMFNSLLGILTAVLAYRISLFVFRDLRTGRFALLLTLFFPSMIVFTTYVLRDAMIFFFTLLMIDRILHAARGLRPVSNSIIALLSFCIIGILRIQNFFLFGGFAALYLLYYMFTSKGRMIKWFLLSMTIIFLTYLLIVNQELLTSIINYPLRAQPLRAEGKSVYLPDMQYQSLFDLIRYLPIRFIYFTFGPFLWNVYSAPMLLSAIEGMLILVFFCLTIVYFYKKPINLNLSAQWFLLLFCLLGLMANALVDSNFGTSVRHRFPYVLFLFMFSGAYLRNIKIRFL
ncbi:MAG: hypothetical protein EHM72_12600 [Calditrichaeota bacterium]|nr:MAG: hypothetical protein EHM72_12600 [Calditrichota bacterium]